MFMPTMQKSEYFAGFNVPACLIMSIAMLAVSGCSGASKHKKEKGASDIALQRDQISKINSWAVEVPMQTSIENAIIRQRVLYDYHFVDGAVRLTPVGRRDARILARHYKGTKWELNLKQGRISDELYQRRLSAIAIMMKANGVVLSDLTIVDGVPGGQGMPSTDARRIRADSIKGVGSLSNGDGYDGGTTVVRPIDTPLEGGF